MNKLPLLKKVNSSNKGFTLVELLIVLAIIAILVGMAIAGIGYANMQSRNNHRLTALSNVEKSLVQFYDDNRYFPSSNQTTFDQIIDEIRPYFEGSWEAPSATVFYYRTDIRNITFMACVSQEQVGGGRLYSCKGTGLGKTPGNWPQSSSDIDCEGVHDPVDCGSGPVYWDATEEIWIQGAP